MQGLDTSRKTVAVIGGGVAGLTAARELSALGARVVLLERNESLGGHASAFTCKATTRCLSCNACLVEDLIRSVSKERAFDIFTATEVVAAERQAGGFLLRLSSKSKDKGETLLAHAVILCSGYAPFDPHRRPQYGFGRIRNLITALEAESIMRKEGLLLRPSDGALPARVAFVQCVGSRDARLGSAFCSRVCCGYALRMGMRIMHQMPGTKVSVFYMDIQNFGKDFERYRREAEGRLRLLRGLPADFYQAEGDAVRMSYFSDEAAMTLREDFDLVVLSVGLMPLDDRSLADGLGLSKDEDGFLMDGADGIFAAGTSKGPMDIAECIASAKAAVLRACCYLGIDPLAGAAKTGRA
jgi:heterodisulfide reductase subunit A